ncbi:uncharacterized protein N7503_001620 [Penicillium pulvis]|uniref:uncharacterized protein n=1 Tax=Penicillium pulvis TaxID=1562058 RepID=UPI0025472903|nr:uncharacterized protein N7503_001620 [Penicillium pulvis]KAJ5809402.1 hypothetical protein N7503_001620 [Penicillium pulvis]
MPGLLSEELYQRLSFFDRTISMLWRRDHPRTWIVSANGEMETGGIHVLAQFWTEQKYTVAN